MENDKTGIYFNEPSEKAPDFIMGNISINIETFKEYIEKHADYINDKGYMNFQLKSSKQGKPYISVNTYGLVTKDKVAEIMADDEEVPLEEIPF